MAKLQRNWCFTDYALADWENVFSRLPDLRYVGYGKETCPETDRVHFQGWLQYAKQIRLTTLKKKLGMPGLHLEACKGSTVANEFYCRKDGDFKSFGAFQVSSSSCTVPRVASAFGLTKGIHKGLPVSHDGGWSSFPT